MNTIDLLIEDLTLDPACQPRAEMNQAVIDDYAIAMAKGTEFEPVVVFHDGQQYWWVDGWHRIAAAKQAGLDSVCAAVRKGGQRDAILFAAGTNATHGLRRTNSDKRRAVTTLLVDAEWSQWSDAEIARRCHVTHPFVGKLRAATTCNGFKSTFRRCADGKLRDTTNIGGLPAAGISLGDVSPEARCLIADLDISEDRRQMARLARYEVDEQVGIAQKLSAGEINTVIQGARQVKAEKFPHGAPPLPDNQYRTIVIDPPWPIEKSPLDARRDLDVLDYATMSLDEIQALDVATRAVDDAFLFLWTTHRHLPAAFGIIGGWGFAYNCLLTWNKVGGFQPLNMPQLSTEFVLMCRHGNPQLSDRKDFKTLFEGKRRGHSRKPVELYNLLHRVTPAPRIDLFSREKHDGFDQWGNATDKFTPSGESAAEPAA